MLLLASPAEARARSATEIAARFAAADQDAFASQLAHRSLLPLLGSRLIELVPGAVSPSFRDRVEADMALTRRRSVAFESAQRSAVGELESVGVRALPLKGITLAIAAHGDVALRPLSDVDLLVRRADLPAALSVLTATDYEPPTDPPWVHGLPLLHYTLRRRSQHGPLLELHWRVHWSEERFSEELLESSSLAADGWRHPEPAHELAELLLFYARDGLSGARLAADIAGWWDRQGASLSPGALDAIADRHPSLRPSLAAASRCLQHHFAVPILHLLRGAPDERAARAVRLADPAGTSPIHEARLVLIDALLSPGLHRLGWFRRYYFQPLPDVRRTYAMQDAPTSLVAGRRFAHTIGGLLGSAPPIAALWWRSGAAPMVRESTSAIPRLSVAQPGPGASQHRLNLTTRARLAIEVLCTYFRVRMLLRGNALPEALSRLRGRPRPKVVAAPEFRLAWLVQSVLRFVPADTRCLMRSMVLLAMLEHRSIASTLVIGTSANGPFGAHAWIECNGEALLWSGGGAFGRLVEL